MKNKTILIYFFIFLIHQIIEKMGFNNTLIDSFLDDFLFLPLFLFSIELILSILSKSSFNLTVNQKIVTIAFILFLVEIIFPKLSNHFTFDYWDFVVYGLGYFFYIGILKISIHDKFQTP